MTKPFKTIDEQIEILRGRGMIVDDSARNVLLAENYYCVVNGYKDMFIDEQASSASPEERYEKGTKFDDLHALFLFDRALREKTFHYLIKAEAIVKSVSVYTFCEEHPEPDSFLNKSHYTSKDDYMLGAESHGDDLDGLVRMLEYKAYKKKECRNSISYYRSKHGKVPLWVLSNDMTFGNTSYFFNLLPRKMQNKVCKRVVDLRAEDDKLLLTPHKMRLALRTLVDFRNKCAHDERLFCEKVGPAKDDTYTDMVDHLSLILPKSDINEVDSSLTDLAKTYAGTQERALKIIEKTGLLVGNPDIKSEVGYGEKGSYGAREAEAGAGRETP